MSFARFARYGELLRVAGILGVFTNGRESLVWTGKTTFFLTRPQAIEATRRKEKRGITGKKWSNYFVRFFEGFYMGIIVIVLGKKRGRNGAIS